MIYLKYLKYRFALIIIKICQIPSNNKIVTLSKDLPDFRKFDCYLTI